MKEVTMLERMAGEDQLFQFEEFKQALIAIKQRMPSSELDIQGQLISLLQAGAAVVWGDAKLNDLSIKVFEAADTDHSNSVDRKEAQRMFEQLHDNGRIPRLPTI